jgi:hypothetical protein
MKTFVKCSCQHCSGHIEFDPAQLTTDNCVISCPHCGSATRLSVVSGARASNYQKTTLRNLGIADRDWGESLDESQANQAIGSAKQIKEYLLELRRDGLIRERMAEDILSSLLCLSSSAIPTASALLAHIQVKYPNLRLSKSYGEIKAHKEQAWEKVMHQGKYAPLISISEVSERQSGKPDSTPAQKRFLRDLGVRDEQTLARLGKFAASDLIEKILASR